MRVVHCKRDRHDVYIGRGSKWGNPFTHLDGTTARFRVRTREEAIAKYAAWIRTQSELMEALPELAGKTLGCWCAPKACHGEILIGLCREKGLIPPREG
jgi:hypothetical protein